MTTDDSLPTVRVANGRHTVVLNGPGFDNLVAAVRECYLHGLDANLATWAGDFVDIATAPATMTVRVRDRSAEARWGSGPTRPFVRAVTISAYCPACGERRGKPENANTCDDGEHYSVDRWTNPCGHLDSYADVVTEANALEGQQ